MVELEIYQCGHCAEKCSYCGYYFKKPSPTMVDWIPPREKYIPFKYVDIIKSTLHISYKGNEFPIDSIEVSISTPSRDMMLMNGSKHRYLARPKETTGVIKMLGTQASSRVLRSLYEKRDYFDVIARGKGDDKIIIRNCNIDTIHTMLDARSGIPYHIIDVLFHSMSDVEAVVGSSERKIRGIQTW